MADEKRPKPKTHIGIADALPILGEVILASSVPADSPSGNVTPGQNFGFVLDSIEGFGPAWNDSGGGAENLRIGVTELLDNNLSLEGIVVMGAAFGIRHYVKHNTSLSRHTIFSTKHHKFTLGS